MLKEQDIICISSIDWDFNWQGHQEIMATFAAHGNRVLFIENTGVRTPALRDLPRLRRRIRNWRRSFKGFRKVRENVWVYSPLILPFPFSRAARRINRLFLLPAVRRWMWALSFRDPIVWTFLPTGTALDLLRALPARLTVYYCIADFEHLARPPGKVRRTEAELLRRCDLVFAQGEVLRDKCRRHNERVSVFPFGVKTEVFSPAAGNGEPPPAELEGLARPLIGYVGGLHRHVDYGLLERLADARPDWSFVLVGPEQQNSGCLRRHPNIRLVGSRPIEALPAFIRQFDVGLIPYRRCPYTDTVYPTKLNEYLALGTPVVSTPLPEVAAFRRRHGPVVSVAEGPEAFLRETEALIRADTPELRRRRMAVAQENAWGRRIEAMSRMMEQRLEEKSREAPAHWSDRLLAVYRRVRRRAVAGVAILALGYGALFCTPLLWWAAEPLKIVEPPRPADAIVVFAGGVGESGRPHQGYEERVAWAVELYRAGYADKLIFSSGYSYRFREPEVMKALAVSLGIPAEDIILETRALNTRENVTRTRAILERRGWDEILLVSSPYHMRRASLVWESAAPGITVVCTPIPESRFYRRDFGPGHPQKIRFRQARALLHEALGILYYWWKGWL